MRRSITASFRLALIVLAFAACGGEDAVEPEPTEAPPDLTGTYTLQSLTSAVMTGGESLTPPGISGGLTARQTSVTGTEATGTMTITVNLPDGSVVEDQGTYTHRLDGTWEQRGQTIQGSGTFTFQDNVLTVEVTEPPIAVSTTVWRRR